MSELADRIAGLESELAPLQKATAEAMWELNVTGEEKWIEESARLQTETRLVLSRREPYEYLRAATRGTDSVDPLLKRQAVLLRNAHA